MQKTETLLQEERLQRAITALAAGEYTVTLLEPGVWSVVNGDHQPYRVTHETCECKDFENISKLGLRCKHVCAIHILFPTLSRSQGDLMEHNPNEPISAWTRLYHPSGVQVTLPISLDKPITADVAKGTLTSVSTLIEAGWLVNAPGLEEGEHVDEVRHVVRRVKSNDDNSDTPIVDLYPERGNFRLLGVYLNDPQSIQAFENACGVHIPDLPLYEGNGTIERGSNPRLEKFVVSLSRPVRVVWKTNPKWEGEEDKKHQKRLLVRWADLAPAAGDNTAAAEAPKHAAGRLYLDGSHVNGDSNEQVTYDAFIKHNNGSKPASKDALKTWFSANRQLVNLNPSRN